MNARLFFFAVTLASGIAARAETASQLLQENGITGGLVVHLNCGDGKLCGELAAANPALVVHGLSADSAQVLDARAHFRTLECADRVSAELWTRETLPFAENLVTLLLADGESAVTEQEAMRVLSPGGTLLRRTAEGWKATKKAPTATEADWTHYQFDASNNPVGTDPDCGVPRRFQWAGKPLWTTSHENMSSVNAMVSANGRVFAIVDEGARASIQLPADWQLVARDAYNGVILWKQPVSNWLTRYWPWKSGPAQMPRKLIAIGDRVYAPLDINGPLMEFDAATGELLQTYTGTGAAEEVIHIDGILLVVVNPDPSNMAEIEAERRKRRHFSYDGRNRVVIDHDKAKRVVAVEAKTGRMLWERVGPKVGPLSLAALNGNVVYHNGESMVCLDLKTGDEKWVSEAVVTERLKMVAEESPTVVLSDKSVFYARNKKITVFSMDDGKVLWTAPWVTNDYRSPVSVMLMHDQVWSMNITSARAAGTFIGRDPLTGEIQTQFDLPPFKGIGHHRCYKAKASGDFVLLSRSGVEYVDPTKQTYDEHHWIRGACLYGILPANGLLFSTPHACACYIKGKLNGFTAMAPGKTESMTPEEDFTEKGSENGKAGFENSPADWPTYRGNVERCGTNPEPVTTNLRQTWKTDLGGKLSSVTIAGGQVFVAQTERNTIHALNAETGESNWAFTAGGTIDSPPTYDRDRVYFGSADGCVYCLRALTGKLVWRTRAAPAERRVIAYGRLESAWPVSGSVLVQQGAVFCAAGRSSFLDGGIRIVKMAADSGEILTSQIVYDLDDSGEQPPLTSSFDMEGALPDILSGDGGSVYMRHLRFETEVLKPAEPAPHLFSPTGYLDANWWHRTYWVYGMDTKAGYGGWWQAANKLPAGRLMVYDEDRVYAFGRSFYAGMNSAQFGRGEKYILYASEKRAGADPDYSIANAERRRGGDLSIDWEQFRTTPFKWKQQLPFHVRAMALADKTLFAAGPYGDAIRSQEAFDGKAGVRLAAANTEDGKLVASYEIDALPVFDGLAAANGKLFMALKDGTVRSFGESGVELPSKLGEPIIEIPEELESSDEEYRKQTQELLGQPGGANRGGGPRKPLKGKSIADQFSLVSGGKVVASEIGIRLGGDAQQTGYALTKLEKPVSTQATWKLRMQAVPGYEQPNFYKNGFLVFGDSPNGDELVKCGIQFIQGIATIFEGEPPGKGNVRTKLDGDLSQVFEVEVSVDLAAQKVLLKCAGKSIEAKLKRKLESVKYVGFASWNSVTDFSKLTSNLP